MMDIGNTIIDPRWLDVDFTSESMNNGLSLGCIPRNLRDEPVGSERDIFEERFGIIPESQWDSYADKLDSEKAWLSELITRVYNQDGEPSCHLPNTDILTEKGWVSWSDYNWKDALATINPITQHLQYQLPLEKHVYEHNGAMVVSDNGRVKFSVTPNHRMYVRKWNEKLRTLSSDYSFVNATDIGWYCGLMAAPKPFIGTRLDRVSIVDDRSYDGNDFMAFLGVMTSDGYVSDPNTSNPRIGFCCFNPDRYDMIAALAQKLGFKEQPSRKGVWYKYGVETQALQNWFRVNMYCKPIYQAQYKKLPDIVKVASSDQIKIFLKYFGDQSHTRTENPQFVSSSKRLIDDLQELHLRIGKRGYIGDNWISDKPIQIHGRDIVARPSYRLSIAKTDRLCLDRKKHIHLEDYKGLVYCATVPNGTLITRQNGSILISGNCVSNAFAQAWEIKCKEAIGRAIHLSAISLYRRVGSRNSGSTLRDNLIEFTKTGVLPLNDTFNLSKFKHCMPSNGYGLKFPDNWKETAALIKQDEYDDINSYEGFVSALLMGHPVMYARSGHCILAVKIVGRGRSRKIGYVNSWGNWGSKLNEMFNYGLGYDSESTVSRVASGAYALRSIVLPQELITAIGV